MKKIIIFCFIIIQNPLLAQKILPFYWLVGHWATETSDGTVYETWKIKDDKTLHALSYMKTTKGDSIALEEVALTFKDDAFFYIVTAKNQNDNKPVAFKMTTSNGDSFAFENPEHDYPKKITYTFEREKNQISASIEGNGKLKEWQFRKKSLPKTFEMMEKDTVYKMKEYYVCFLKKGFNRNHTKEDAAKIQTEHLSHINKMYGLGLISLVGPYGGDGEIRGMTVFNTPNIEEAIWWANQDPAVKAGRLVVEVHPWWTAVGGVMK